MIVLLQTKPYRLKTTRTNSEIKKIALSSMALVEEGLKTLLEQIAFEQGYKNYSLDILPISSGGANYTSVLYKAKVKENNKNDLNLFAKVAIDNTKMREQLSSDFNVYEAERYVYTIIKRYFTKLEDKHNVPDADRLVLSKYYGAHTKFNEEILVLEDLTAKGFSTYDRHKSVDWAYASASVKELAKFHALAMAFQREYPEEHEKFCREYIPDWINEETFNSLIKSNFNKAVEVVSNENRDKLKKFLDKLDVEKVRDMLKPCRKPVLVHTDYRMSNLMHRFRKDGSVDIIPVDLQTIGDGCVVVDLVYFIITGTDKEFRRLHYQRLIDHYFTELSAAMARLGVDSSYYSRDDFDYELKEKLPYGLLVAVFVLPIVTVDTEDAPKLDADLDTSSFANCKPGTIYPERLNGVVDDYVRWGVLE